MYVYYVCKHWYMDDLNRTDRYNDIGPIWGSSFFLVMLKGLNDGDYI